MYSILIIDGDQESKTDMREALEKEGYKLYCSVRAKPGFDKAREKLPDLIIMELLFPDMDGFDLLRTIKSDAKLKDTPVIILSEKGDDFDKVLSFGLGADDYVVKPPYAKEIAARVKAQLKYVKKNSVDEPVNDKILIRYGDIVINPMENEVLINGEQVIFSAKEFRIMYILLKNAGRIMKKELILNYLCPNDTVIAKKLLSAYINNIKQKICKHSSYDFNIHSAGKSGYRIEFRRKNELAI